MFVTRFLLGSGAVSRSAVEELQREAQESTGHKLDDLDHRLVADGDSRTEQCLRDLRVLAESFKEGQSGCSSLNATSTFDILSNVDDLFAECVRSLEKTLELWHAANRMSSEEARQPLLQQRETIIAEVEESIAQLGRILASIQNYSRGEKSTAELARLRNELEQSMAIAKRVDEKMNAWRTGDMDLE
ncbi:MAG: hypothetical protein ACYTBZ_07415 [Planctomycetota bacterium]